MEASCIVGDDLNGGSLASSERLPDVVRDHAAWSQGLDRNERGQRFVHRGQTGIELRAGRDFVCGRDEIALTGKVTGSKLTGYGFDTSGLRSTFTCRAVDTCP